MKIERLKELLLIFENGVSHNPKKGLNNVLEYQDIIGHSTKQEIIDFEELLERGHEKKHFQWVNFLTLSEDMAMDILKNTVIRRQIQTWENDFEEYMDTRAKDIAKKEVIFEECKKSIFKKIGKFRSENDFLKNKISDLNTIINNWTKSFAQINNKVRDLEDRLAEREENAVKYRQIKELLN